MSELEYESPKVTIEAIVAAEAALKEIRNRSFSGRHPELGKMVNCKVCNLRHRDSQKCVQVFTTKWFEEDLETGEVEPIFATTPETKNGVLGARMFKGKRLKPHPNKKKLQFIELVRELLPQEYDDKDMERARKIAGQRLAKKLGRHGFLPPIWKKQVKQEAV